MNRTIYKFFFIFSMLFPLLSLPGCKDDDLQIEEDQGNIPDDENEPTLLITAYLEDYLVHNLCEVDSLDDSRIISSRYGEPLIEGLPTELSCSFKDVNAAYDFFRNTLVAPQEGEKYLFGDQSQMVYDLGLNGKVTFIGSGRQPGEIAEIVFDIPRLKDVITKLHILSPDAWPENNTSPFAVGDILKENVNGRDYYWLVVREYQGGVDGIMMTLDYGWTVTERSDDYKKYKSYKGCASKDAWDALSQWWFDDEADFRNEYKAIKDIVKNDRGRVMGYIIDIFDRTIQSAEAYKIFSTSFRPGQLRPFDWLNAAKNIVEYQYGDTRDNKYQWWIFVSVWESRSNYVVLGARENENSTKFKSGSYYFKRDWDPEVPSHRNSSSRTFKSDKNNQLSNQYTTVYPEY